MIAGPSPNDRGWERAELLQRAWALDAAVEMRELVSLLAALPEAELLGEPELGFLLARNWRRTGERERALDLLVKLREPMLRLGNSRLARRTRSLEGGLRFEFGELEAARILWLGMLEDSMRAKDEFTQSLALSGLAILNGLQLRLPESLALYQRAFIAHAGMSRRDIANDLISMAEVYREMNFLQESDTTLQHAMALITRAPDREMYALAGVKRAVITADRGEIRLAAEMADRFHGMVDREKQGIDPNRDADMLQLRARIARLDGRLGEARAMLEEAQVIVSTPGHRWILADTWVERTHLELASGKRVAAEEAAHEAARTFRSIGADRRADLALDILRQTP